jgi:hypothetical protein
MDDNEAFNNRAFIVTNNTVLKLEYIANKYSLKTVAINTGLLFWDDYTLYDVESYPMPVMILEDAPLYLNDRYLSGYAKCLLEDRSLMDE